MDRMTKLTLLKRFAPNLYASRRLVELDDIDLQKRAADAMVHVAADNNGLLGLTYDPAIQAWRNHDSGAVYGQIGEMIRDAVRDEMYQIRTLLIAAGPQGAKQAAEMLPAEPATMLPEHVPLRSLIDTSSFRNLVLGVSASGTIRADLADLVHVAIGGSSGWGKSVFLRAIGYQLATSIEPVDLVMVDLEKTTLAPFDGCDRLLYPVIDGEAETVAVFRELTDELDRRKELFSTFPGVDSLYHYNAQADEQIRPLVVIGDEITALLSDKSVEAHLRTLALRARKYGMWLILAGQDWRAASLDIAIRNQLSCCVQFKAKSAAQSRILLDNSTAQDITVKGRAMAWLPGQEMLEMQAPIIGPQDIISAMTGSGPQRDVPDFECDDLNYKVREAWERLDRPSITAVCREVFNGQQGGANWERVKNIVYSTGLL